MQWRHSYAIWNDLIHRGWSVLVSLQPPCVQKFQNFSVVTEICFLTKFVFIYFLTWFRKCHLQPIEGFWGMGCTDLMQARAIWCIRAWSANAPSSAWSTNAICSTLVSFVFPSPMLPIELLILLYINGNACKEQCMLPCCAMFNQDCWTKSMWGDCHSAVFSKKVPFSHCSPD